MARKPSKRWVEMTAPGALTRYDDPDYRKQVSLQMLATPTHEIACRAITDLHSTIAQRAQELERVKERLRRYNHWTPEHTIEEWLADRQRIVDAKHVEADAQLQATLASRELTWTKETPKEAGWYFWRDPNGKEHSAKGLVVEVYEGEGGALLVLRGGSYGDVKWVATLDGEWSDKPIPLPDDKGV